MLLLFFKKERSFLPLFLVFGLLSFILSIYSISPAFGESTPEEPFLNTPNQSSSYQNSENQNSINDSGINSSNTSTTGNYNPTVHPKKQGNPSTELNLSKPISEGMIIVMTPNEPFMSINGIMFEIDPGRGTSPIIVQDRALIPIVSLVNVLGGNTSWDPESQRITIELNGSIIEFGLNSPKVTVNGVSKQMEITPVFFNDRIFVPIRFLVENCSVAIEWTNNQMIILPTYLPEGIQLSKKLFSNTPDLENFEKLPSVVHLLTRII